MTDEEPADETEEMPSPRRKANGPGEASIKQVPGYDEGDQHLEIHIHDKDITDVLALLGEAGGLNILPGPSVQGAVSASFSNVSVDEALDAILKSMGFTAKRDGKFVYVGTPQDFELMQQTNDRIGMRVYRPNYIAAKDLSQLLTPLLSRPPIGKISVSTPSEIGIATNANQAGGNSLTEGEAVVVQDYESVLAEVDQVVKELDKRPAQVAIEAMILSVQLDDANKFGINFQVLRNQQNLLMGLGNPSSALNSSGTTPAPTSGTGTGTGTTTTSGPQPFNMTGGGLQFAYLDGSLGAFLTALETIADTNVIATPKVMCLNKQRAEIQIGAQLGYVTTTMTSTSTAQSINFLDIGAQLRLRPYISSDGMIRMEVHPELSTGTVTQQGNFTLPNKELTQVTTNVMVRDGSTVVIGGLMREDLTTNTNQLPILGNLPFVGFLFRTKAEDVKRSEILILLTPRIVYQAELDHAGQSAAEQFIRREAVYSDHMSPISKRYMARKNFRMAQYAWSVGDRRSALRLVNRSVYFDPRNRAAIEFREALVNGTAPPADADFSLAPPSEHPLDGDEIAPWVLEELEGVGGDAELPRHPLEPGEPGPIIDLKRPGASDDGEP